MQKRNSYCTGNRKPGGNVFSGNELQAGRAGILSNAVKIITDVSLDGKTDFIPVSYRKEKEGVYCIYSLWTYKTCRIDKIKGVREIQEILPDLHFQMVCEEGMETEVVPGTGAMMMNISFCRKSQKEISETIREINRMVFVYDQENKDILAKFTGDL